jgi:hypothetical protein
MLISGLIHKKIARDRNRRRYLPLKPQKKL